LQLIHATVISNRELFGK